MTSSSEMRRPADSRVAAYVLNRGCVCNSVDHAILRQALEGAGGVEAGGISYAALMESHPNLFSDTRVYVAEAHLDFMADLIAAIERVVALAAWRERVLAYAPEIARRAPKAAGVFLGYDFHLGDDGPKLIEINTNAGGPLLNARLSKAQRACCERMEGLVPEPKPFESDFVEMFRKEWQLARGGARLKNLVIVDDAPECQFLAPEFELFRQLFEGHGIAAAVLAPDQLSYDGVHLRYDGKVVDMIYNRLTDFSLDEPEHRGLRAAYLDDAAVLTPHPHAHAIYADKRNLAALADHAWLRTIGVGEEDRRLLQAGVPPAEEVRPDNAQRYWADRKAWFFKPVGGYGGKGAYRGDKLTRRVFGEISRGGYVAQALISPSERRLLVDGVERSLKLDLRNYVYRGRVQLVSARLYRGQTTNFRTPGGSFSAVFPVPSGKPEEAAR